MPRYIPTSDFFETIKFMRTNEDLKLSDAKWLRIYYASSSKYKMLSENQAIVLNEILERYGYDLSDLIQEESI